MPGFVPRTHRLAGGAEGPPQAACPHPSCWCCSSCPSCPGWHARFPRSCRSPSWTLSKTSPHTSSRAAGSNLLREEESRAEPTHGGHVSPSFNLVPFLSRERHEPEGKAQMQSATPAHLMRKKMLTESNDGCLRNSGGQATSLLLWDGQRSL